MCRAASIAGMIVDDASQTPLPNVTLEIAGRQYRNRLNGKDDGTFQTGELNPGDYRIVFWIKGYLVTAISVRVNDASKTDLAAPSPLLVRMVRLGNIQGHLTGLQGRSARVMALALSSSAPAAWNPALDSIAVCCSVASMRGIAVDADGAFGIPDLPPGTYALLVRYGNASLPEGGVRSTLGLLRYPANNGGFELDEGSTLVVQISVPSGPSRVIEGLVDLREVGQWYWITLSDPNEPALAVATTTSDEHGSFAFDGVVAGAYELLAVPGTGPINSKSAAARSSAFTGFDRARVDVRQQDIRNVRLAPREIIGGSVALRMTSPSRSCRNALVTLTPLEDWGVNLERTRELVKVGLSSEPPWPEFINGLPPSKFGIGQRSECEVLNRPLLDLTNTRAGNVEVPMAAPGSVRGHVLKPNNDPGNWEVMLLPDDFAEGWPFLPITWFESPLANGGFYFGGDTPGSFPYVRISVLDSEAAFNFTNVPAGRYHIAVRSADLPAAIPNPTRWHEMQQIEVQSSVITTMDPTIPGR